MTLGAAMSVLLIEDDEADAELLQEAVVACALPWKIRHVTDAQQGLLALAGGPPQLILTDRCLPGCTSADLLDALNADPRTRSIPIVVLAGPMSDHDRRACLDRRARAVLQKPDGFMDYLELVQDLHARWSDGAS